MRVLVTGGGGFLGQAIVRRLIARGDLVKALQRSKAPDLVSLGVECISGDISDVAATNHAVSGCDAVFHVAAKAGVWGSYDEFHRANVTGTENVVSSCQAFGVRKLIYTSSPSVVFDGRDESGIDESVPYPTRYLTHYQLTKAVAERIVLAANGPKLATVSLRPHLIWGPGDNHLVPRLFQRARQNKLRRIGPGTNLVDATYIDNAAEAHLLASNALDIGSTVAGKAYFVSNGEPVPLWNLIDRLLACADIPPIRRTIPATTAYNLGWLFEVIYKLAGRRDEPPMTRFVARQLSTSHWYSLDAARRDFGYVPSISIEEGLKRLAMSLR